MGIPGLGLRRGTGVYGCGKLIWRARNIYDHVGSDPLNCCGVVVDPIYRDDTSSLPLPQKPIPLRLQPLPYIDGPFPVIESARTSTLVSGWSDENLELDPGVWSTDWSGGFLGWARWFGNQGDMRWLLVHAFHFPGTVSPQAYATPPEWDDTFLIVRSGNRYLISSTHSEKWPIRSLPLGPFPPDFNFRGTDYQPCMSPTAMTVAKVYDSLMSLRERNRNL
ncbi:hypothetical protein B0H16DRAFT_1575022 [Mycena metata]|uniref:Uncharacterized protein n=1 Tax=Mycena metata TaxID=1033252 RepID=A0AAD7I835_9AGAR|nr:hypothetical protein B0H16DRAFT_1575022 [Mycena metata]